MHILDGALSTPVLVGGGIAAAAGVAYGLKKMDPEDLPQVGVLSAVFFVASLIHVPIGPSSVHLIVNGLLGLVLGWTAFPALLVALLLQAVFFGFGGVTTLGVNCLNIALPGVIAYYVCRAGVVSGKGNAPAIWGFVAGAMSIALTTVMVAVSLFLSGDAFFEAAWFVFYAHLPVMIVEGLLTAATVHLVVKVKPELLHVAR